MDSLFKLWFEPVVEKSFCLSDYFDRENAVRVPLFDLKRQFRSIEPEIMRSIRDIFKNQRFVLGPYGEKLEREIARFVGVPYAVGVANGSDSLYLALLALGVGPGDEVVTTPFTFFATAGAVSRVGARPVFVDIDPRTFNIDPAKIEAAITKRTKAIMPVHLFGLCCEMDAISKIARRHGL